jgi:signal transduction histidine kinase
MADAPRVGGSTLLRAITPLLVIMPVSIVILLWGVGRGLRPLDELAARIEDRRPAALDPIDPAGVPREILPVVTSLNGLLDRLQRALVSEQRFTSNAAHELQTPLAAIKAEVQRCQRKASGNDDRIMLERIDARVSRAVDTTAQLLILARLDPETEFKVGPVVLSDLVVDLVAEEGDLVSERRLEIRVEEDPDAVVHGHAEWLKILVRNLLSNAFKFTPEHGGVVISIERRGPGQVAFSVINDCHPIGDEELLLLTDRFFTLPGQEGAGVGLGLSIVKRIAELHGATLQLREDRGRRQFLAEVRFGAAGSPG